jgi:hypothetical protein
VPQTPSNGGGGGITSYEDLTDVPNTFPPETHTHTIADTTGLQPALDGKSDSSHTHSEYLATSGGITAIALVSEMPADPNASTLYIVS